MAKQSNQKFKILYLKKILIEKTDEENTMTLNEILLELEKFGVKAERKSIYDDIETLRTFGIDIVTRKSKTTEYYVGNRTFEMPELKLLVDAVQGSKFITQKKSTELIKKIEGLTSTNMAKGLHSQVFITNRVKNLNENIYYNIDKLHTGIIGDRQVTFKYFDYNMKKEKEYRKNGNLYTVTPSALSWDDENYYLISFSEKYGNFTHYRVDRMSDIEITESKRAKLPENIEFDIAQYSKKMFNMFCGEEDILTLQFDNSLINVVIDRFGREINIQKVDDNRFTIRVKIAVSSTFFAWIFQFGSKVKILLPENVVSQYKRSLQEIIDGIL